MNYIDLSYTPLLYEPKYNCSNILLIDSSVEDYQTIVDSVNSNTMAIVYSYSSTKEDLSMVLSNFTSISRIAFAFCSNANNCPVTFLDNNPFFLISPIIDNSSENLLFLIDIFEKYNVQHVDYLACNTLEYIEWNNYYNYLIEKTNTVIGASNDKTGNIKYGGDWILENTLEDIQSIYFTKNIEYYKYLLDNANWVSGLGAYQPAGITYYNYNIYVGGFSATHIKQIPINSNGTAGTAVTWYTSTGSLYSVAYYNGFIYTSRTPNSNSPIIQIPVNANGTAGTANINWTASITTPFSMIGYQSGSNSYLFLASTQTATSGLIRQIPINANNSAGTIVTWYNTPATQLAINNSIMYASDQMNKRILIIPINSNGTAGTLSTVVTTTTTFGIAIYNSYLYTNTYTGGGVSYIKQIPINANGTLGTINNTWRASTNDYFMTIGQSPSGNYAVYDTHVNNGVISTFDISAAAVIINIGTNPTGIKYKSGTNFIDISNNFSSINLVTNPQFSGQNFSTGIFCYYNSSKYDLAQLYSLNSTIVQIPAINTNIFTRYNSSLYDINSFLNPNVSVVPTGGLLGTLTTTSPSWKSCYSLRKLVGIYSGFIINIRRASDNNTMSFYSTDTGVLTSEPNGAGTEIATFLSATTGFVTTWYDQSGKNNNATQTNAAFQPIIDLTNNCLNFGYSNNQNLYFNIPNGTVPVGVLNASYSFVVKHGNTLNTGGGFIGAGNIGVGNQVNSWRFLGNTRTYRNYWWGNDFDYGNTDTTIPIVASVTYNGSTFIQKGYRGDVLVKTTTNRKGGTTSNVAQSIGRIGTDEYLKGQMYALLIFSAELPQSDITILNTL
jgi:hypothetical protein